MTAALFHTGAHYARLVPQARGELGEVLYSNLLAVHEVLFIALIAFAAYRWRALGGVLLLTIAVASSVPYALSPRLLHPLPVSNVLAGSPSGGLQSSEGPSDQVHAEGRWALGMGLPALPSLGVPGVLDGGGRYSSSVSGRSLEIALILAIGAFVTILSELRGRDHDKRDIALAQARATNRRLTALYEADQALAQASTLSEAPGAAARAVARHFGGECAVAMYLFSADADTFLLGAREGLEARVAQAMNTLRGVSIREVAESRAWQQLPLSALPAEMLALCQGLEPQGFQSCVLGPIRVQGEWLALLIVAFREVTIASEDMELLAGIGQQTAQAIWNAQLYESERRERQIAEALVRSLRAQVEGGSKAALAASPQRQLSFSPRLGTGLTEP